MIKRLLTIFLLCSAQGAAASAAGPSERAETLRAINWVENPTNHTRRGPKGELGPYQFRAQTWRLHTNKSFQLATVREHADEIAVRHYEWIKAGLHDAGIEPTPFNIALAWNSGLGAVQRGQVPTVSYRYAERVANLVESQQANRAAIASMPATGVPLAAKDSSRRPTGALRFSLEPAAPRFPIDPSLYEPVVVTDKTAADSSAVAKIKLDVPGLTFATTAPRVALLP